MVLEIFDYFMVFSSCSENGWNKFSTKKKWKFYVGDPNVSPRSPAVVKIPEIKNSDRRLFPECRDIAQLPVAQKLQLPEVGKNLGKFQKTGPLKLEELVTISNN